MANSITVASPPTTAEAAQLLLAALAAQSGVATDYNVGSQVRTLAEGLGSVEEISGISAVAVALQVIAYGAMSLFGITPSGAIPASGSILYATALVNGPPVSQAVFIPQGSLVGTLSGIQFATTASVTLASGASGVTTSIAAVQGGYNTNVAAGSITQPLGGLSAPLVVTNPAATSGGFDAETPNQALNRLAALFLSLVGGSPVSVANACVGVVASGTGERVVYSTCYEGWLDPNSPNFPNTPNFVAFIDNGSGTASTQLIGAVQAKLQGAITTSTPGFRPSGMPFSVSGVVPILANVAVTGTLGPLANAPQLTSAIASGVSGYFTLPFNTPASQPQLAAEIANSALGQLTSLQVSLYYASNPTVPVQIVSGAPYTRVILNQLITFLS